MAKKKNPKTDVVKKCFAVLMEEDDLVAITSQEIVLHAANEYKVDLSKDKDLISRVKYDLKKQMNQNSYVAPTSTPVVAQVEEKEEGSYDSVEDMLLELGEVRNKIAELQQEEAELVADITDEWNRITSEISNCGIDIPGAFKKPDLSMADEDK